jgi:hypothetical protein
MRWVITLLLGLGLGICIFCLLDSSTTPPPTSKETESEDTGYVEVGAAENGSPAKAGFDRSGQQGAVPTQREDGTPRDTTEPRRMVSLDSWRCQRGSAATRSRCNQMNSY